MTSSWRELTRPAIHDSRTARVSRHAQTLLAELRDASWRALSFARDAIFEAHSGSGPLPQAHPFYEARRPEMEATMRQRVDLIDELLRDRLALADTAAVKDDIMQEFGVVLAQMPYVGGTESRMSDFFMRLLGFMAIGRVLQRQDVPSEVIGELELESFQRHMLTMPEAERLESGRQFMSDANKALVREQAARSRDQKYPGDFVYDFVEPGPGDSFEFGVNYRACGFCKFAGKHGDLDLLPHLCGLDFAAYELRGIRLERTQTLAKGAPHCDFRFTRLPAIEDKAER